MTDFSLKMLRRGLLIAGVAGGSLALSAQPLAGVYTIDTALPAAGNNFTSFNAAVSALAANGISAAVTFDIAPGTYNEQVILPPVSGASATETITFDGSAGATLAFTAVNTAQRAVLKLDGADYITIKGLHIEAGGATNSEYGYGIQLINGADHNTIKDCSVNVLQTVSSTPATSYAGILVNYTADAIVTPGNSNCHYNKIEFNTVSGGQHGIVVIGGAGSSELVSGNVVRSNTVQDFYNTGIYLSGNAGTVVESNDIWRPNRAAAAQFYGVQLNGLNSGVQVLKNRIHDPFGGTSSYVTSGAIGIYLTNVAPGAGNENLIYNNIIYNIKSGSIIRGIWVSSSSDARFIHNTISFDDEDYTGVSGGNGFEISGSANLTIQNNIVSMKRAGTSFTSRYGISVSGTVTGFEVGGNVLYLPHPNSVTYTGRWGNTNCSTLADWASVSGDATSIAEDPQFINAAGGNLLPANFALQAGLPVTVTGVGADIEGTGRSSIPTIGAFEIGGVVLPVAWSPLSGSMQNGQAVLSWETYHEQHNVGFHVQRSADARNWENAGWVPAKAEEGVAPATIAYTFTDPFPYNGRIFYRLAQADRDGKTAYSNTVLLTAGNNGALLRVYPNPARDLLTFSPGRLRAGEEAVMCISDMSGKVVYRQPVTAQTCTVPVGSLPSGHYLLTVTSAAGREYSPFTKQ